MMKTEKEIKKRLGSAMEALMELEDYSDFINRIAKIETKEAIRTLEWVLDEKEK